MLTPREQLAALSLDQQEQVLAITALVRPFLHRQTQQAKLAIALLYTEERVAEWIEHELK